MSRPLYTLKQLVLTVSGLLMDYSELRVTSNHEPVSPDVSNVKYSQDVSYLAIFRKISGFNG